MSERNGRAPADTLEAEIAALGSALLSPVAASLVAERLNASHFTNHGLAVLHAVIAELVRRGGALDVVELRDELERREGVPEPLRQNAAGLLARCMAEVPSAANVEVYVRLLERAHAERAVARALDGVRGCASGAELQVASARLRVAEDALAAVEGGARVSLADELAAHRAGETPRRRVLIQGFAKEKDLGVLFGPAGRAKTQLSTAVAAHLSVGPAAGPAVRGLPRGHGASFTPSERCAVAIVAYEDEREDLLERLDGLFRAPLPDAPPPNLRLLTPRDAERDLRGPTGWAYFERAVRELARDFASLPPVVVLDNLGSALAGLDKSSETEVSAFLGRLLALRDRYGLTTLLIAHANKSGADADARSALDRLLGSQVWGATATGAAFLNWIQGAPRRSLLTCAKLRGFGPWEPVTVNVPPGDCQFEALDVPAEPDARSAPERGADALEELLGVELSMPKSEVLSRLCVSDSSLRRFYAAAAERVPALVSRTEGGGKGAETVYFLTDAGARRFGIDGAGAQP